MEWIDHPEFIKKLTGLDPFLYPSKAILETIKYLDIDWYIRIPQKAYKFDGTETKKAMNEGQYITEWGFTGSFWEKDFEFVSEEVLQYNPLDDRKEKVRIVSRKYRKESIDVAVNGQKLAGENALITGLYYTMLFQCFIMAFGWELFLITAASEPEKFKNTIELFAEFSLQNTKEWAQTDLPVFFCHDDLAVSRGLVFPVEWYRKNIIPEYEKILDPIRKVVRRSYLFQMVISES